MQINFCYKTTTRLKYIAVFLLLPVVISAQIDLTIEGQTYTNSDETWLGVNIPRSDPTNFVFKNNIITSSNIYGYMLLAGDEAPNSWNNWSEARERQGDNGAVTYIFKPDETSMYLHTQTQ